MTPVMDRLVIAAAELTVAFRLRRIIRWTARQQPAGAARRLHVARPRTGNEKFLWRKAFDHDPRFVVVSDKIACKAWIEGLGLGLAAAPLRWQGRDAAAIPPALLAEDVVVKANHGCGTNLFPRRDDLPRAEVVERANGFLRMDHGRSTREWAYRRIDRRLLVEDRLDAPGRPIAELKFYTFGPLVPRVVHIADRFGAMAAARWEAGEDGTPRRSDEATSVSDRLLDAPLPACFPRALALARAIGARFDHMRVDLLTDGERLWLGELTVYNLSGMFPDCGHQADSNLSRAWDIRGSWFLTARHQSPWRRLYAGALRRELAREAPAGPPPPSL